MARRACPEVGQFARRLLRSAAMFSLRARLTALTTKFADDVLAAIRTASIEELTTDGAAPRRPPGRAPSFGRLGPRPRMADEVEQTLGLLVAALKVGPMRAADISAKLGIDRKQLPPVVALGIAKKVIKKRGIKRATTYWGA